LSNQTNHVDVVVVGAGFAGLRALHTLRGQGHRVAVLEGASGIGGVWYANRYPGARCDVESHDYSYSFSPELEQEWRWSERYCTQPEILRYIDHVTDRFDLRRDIHLDTRVVSASLNEETLGWTIVTEAGATWTARYLIMAVGQLSKTKAPILSGSEEFGGDIHHTAEWPHDGVDFTGKRVGIIGTGSSGMQAIPIIAQEAAYLTVFQRTPNFSVPACNAIITDEEDAAVKADYATRRAQARNSPSGLGFVTNKQSALEVDDDERNAAFEAAYHRLGFGFALAYYDILLNVKANETAAEFIRNKIAALVNDPETLQKLTPTDHPFAAKRPSVDSGYFETFNRDNVELVDIRTDPIEQLEPTGVQTATKLHELDVLIYATGFDAMTGSLLKPTITGRNGVTLNNKWSAGPVTYLGIGTTGFPNLFIIAGPGSPSLLSNVLLSIEQHVDWITALIAHGDAAGTTSIEVSQTAEDDWVAHVNERALETVYPLARSYYMGDEVEGKPRVFMPYSGGVRGYRRILEKVVADGYDGFVFSNP
jgi:cation diffusion facilitator CzcD-associated flavoprotein CzcO